MAETCYAAWAELERRFDGPIPMPLRWLTAFGSAERLMLIEAEGQAAFFAAMVRGQLIAIRRSEAAGLETVRLRRDLALYRRRRRWWRSEAGRLRAAFTPSADGAP